MARPAMHTQRRMLVRIIGFLVAAYFLVRVASHPHAVDLTDEELEEMDIETLIHLETDYRNQNKVVDEHVGALQERLKKLHEEQLLVEKAYKKAESARSWENRHRVEREKELERAKAQLATKTEEARRIESHIKSMRKEIQEMREKLNSLNHNKEDAEKMYASPSLSDIIDSKVRKMGATPQGFYKKTMEDVVPLIKKNYANAKNLGQQFSRVSTPLAFLCTTSIYVLLLWTMAAMYRFVRRLRGKLTLSKISLAGHLLCAAFWGCVVLWHGALLQDPLVCVKDRSESFFFVFQIFVLLAYLFFIGVHVLKAAVELAGKAIGELVGVIIVGQHYFSYIWGPSIGDGQFGGGLFYYSCYFGFFVMIIHMRIREPEDRRLMSAKSNVMLKISKWSEKFCKTLHSKVLSFLAGTRPYTGYKSELEEYSDYECSDICSASAESIVSGISQFSFLRNSRGSKCNGRKKRN